MHTRSWRTIILLALLLLSAQTVLAWHGAELHDHLAADECQVCLHLSAVKHGAGANATFGIDPEFRITSQRGSNSAVHLPGTVASHYQSRAPPAV